MPRKAANRDISPFREPAKDPAIRLSSGSEHKPTIMIVDDEPNTRESFAMILGDDYNIICAETGTRAIDRVKNHHIDLVLLDILMPPPDGIETLKKIKEIDNTIEVIMVSAASDIKLSVEAIKLGAYDYVTKPFDVDDLLALVKRALEKRSWVREAAYLRAEASKGKFGPLIGASDLMKKIFQLIETVAPSDSTVLILGESGTGKELCAQAIHRNSPRVDKPFVTVNCATIPEHLLESELFGHEKGSFTDAHEQKLGKFELANQGTVFLDEIGTMDFAMQAKLLRFLEERKVERVGGTKSIPVDVRLIAATNSDLKKAIKENQFREDLYFRLHVIPITMPPLRERKEDIKPLIEYFLKDFNAQFNKKIKGVTPEAMSLLTNYDWPGNVRELENLMERLVVLESSEYINADKLPIDILSGYVEMPELPAEGVMPLKVACHQFEKQFIKNVLDKAEGNQSRAAQMLGIHRNTLILKMRTLGLK